MNLKELDRLAEENEPMPNLNWYETVYYQASRYLYRQYDIKAITVAQAREEKEIIVKQYEENKREYEFLIRLHSVEDMLKKLRDQGFNTALEQEILEEIDRVLK